MVLLTAPAKLTLSLRVVGTREDGLHLIDAEMVTLDLCDVLALEPGGNGIEIVDELPFDTATPSVPEGADNLVLRALQATGRSAGVRLRKRIPAGAGLGGGSADAAAVLRWADAADPHLAASLGADVAFCVVGGRARVRGIGELVEPLVFEQRTFTLLTPPFGCSTPAVYAAWDELCARGARPGEGRNDLEPAALVIAPQLARWRDELAGATGERPTLAGSGSTWFVEGAHPGPGRIVARTVPAGWDAPEAA